MHWFIIFHIEAILPWFYRVSFTHFRKHLFPWPFSKLYLVRDNTESFGLRRNHCELSAGKSVSVTGSFWVTWPLFTLFTWFREKLYSDELYLNGKPWVDLEGELSLECPLSLSSKCICHTQETEGSCGLHGKEIVLAYSSVLWIPFGMFTKWLCKSVAPPHPPKVDSLIHSLINWFIHIPSLPPSLLYPCFLPPCLIPERI